MLKRGKFTSLMMINWNGFFARKFDLDNLVTTLSGGNGAGKSTTMAAFITALIPDLSLLHFRNTTEAGSTSSSRDRGLHGKLKSGVCFAVLECENSRGDHMLFGVRLQQVAGRDKKVDLKLFSIQGLTGNEDSIQLFFEQVGDKAKILNVNALKTKYDGSGTYTFKQYHSIGDYHAQMFDYGFLPKRLRTPQDRSRFYRLIEASLYGGISSAITKSLREYLLPENQSVKQAFQDMESAILENRMTINKIEQTRQDRNFFRSLVDTAVDYVASDYIFQQNNRTSYIHTALQARKAAYSLAHRQAELTQAINNFANHKAQLDKNYKDACDKYEQANDYHSLLLAAFNTQVQYDEKLVQVQTLTEEKEIAEEQVSNISEERLELEELLIANDKEMSSLMRELSDSETALDQNATRQVQYKQAQEKLQELVQVYSQVLDQQLLVPQDIATKLNIDPDSTQAKALTNYEHAYSEIAQLNASALGIDQVDTLNKVNHQALSFYQEQSYHLNNALQINTTSRQSYDKAFNALTALYNGSTIDPNQAYAKAQVLLKGLGLKRSLAERVDQLKREFGNLNSRYQQAMSSTDVVEQLQQQLGQGFSSKAEIVEAFDLNQATYSELDEKRSNLKEELAQFSSKMSIITNELNDLNRLRMPYYKAQDELTELNRKLEQPITSEEQLRQAVNDYLNLTNSQQIKLLNLQQQRDDLFENVSKLERQSMGINQQLQNLAQDLGGVLISEIYDDITIEDASYYSALYGPARDAIVVPSFEGIEDKLENHQDLPPDLYLIEGDFNDFNEDIFNRINHENAVLVHINDNQIRYSTFQQATTFGKAAREKYIEQSREQLKDILYEISQLEPQYFSNKKILDNLTDFFSQHMDMAFKPNPEQRSQELSKQAAQLERQVNSYTFELQNLTSKISDLSNKSGILSRLMQVFTDDNSGSLEEDYHRVKNDLANASEAQRYFAQYGKYIDELEHHYQTLQYPPQETAELQAQLQVVKANLQHLNKIENLCAELHNRKEHFDYADLGDYSSDELRDKIRKKLDLKQAEKADLQTKKSLINASYEQARDEQFRIQAYLNEAKSSLESLSQALSQSGGAVTQQTVDQAKARMQEYLKIANAENEKLIKASSEFDNNQERLQNLEAEIKQAQREYEIQRSTVLESKQKWQTSQALAQEHEVVSRLLPAELRTLSNEELRSRSDRALGQLRSLINDNEYLRDSLKASEDNRRPYLKVQFFIDVYSHLRERIRQDVLTTNDPIEAIEQMEIQLDRLSSQLTQREKSLVISAGDVASILDKTIQREQNRIWQLNQGLQNMSFGQVKSVRLNATYRQSHAQLLNALREGREKHADLFDNSELSFTEALAKLYQRTNSEFEIGQRNFQTVGEELLDYRNYIDLGIEVFRGSDGWLKAESGALSTGEAIGTGMSILLMVVQSWEEESRRMRAKDLLPCRLLLLDEAARLDAKSIATLFELCDRQQMQLLIAAPENISPDNGTTYKLMRRIEGKREYVHVVGLRGFGHKAPVAVTNANDTATETANKN